MDWTIGPLDYFLDYFLDHFIQGGGGGRQTIST